MDRVCASCTHGGNCGDIDENVITPACWESGEGEFEVCHYCFGAGYLSNEGYAECPYCGGTGYEEISEFDDDYDEEAPNE